jgi:hypothetical protein
MRALIVVFAFLVALAQVSSTSAELASGLSFTEITPADFGGSTVLSLAFAPDRHLFASNGLFLSTVPLDGSPSTSESLIPPIPLHAVASDIIFDSSGNLYIADFWSARILVRAAGQQTFNVFATGLEWPRRMVFDLDGSLLVMGGNGNIDNTGYVKRVDRSGNTSVITSAIVGPVAIAINSSGEIFVLTWQSGVFKVSHEGTVQFFIALPPSLVARGVSLAINAYDHLFVCIDNGASDGHNNSSLYRTTPAGEITLLGTNVGDDGIQADLVFSAEGELFAANFRPEAFSSTVLRISGAPVQRADCFNGAWANFFNPPFKNQGACVSYVNRRAP